MSLWMFARGAGLSALVLLTVSVALGSIVSARVPIRPDRRVLVQYVHRAAATLGLAVLGLHITAILADSLAHVGVIGALVPFTSSYRPLWVGLGSIALYLVLLTAATGFLRGRMAASERAAKAWRRIHVASYGAWALAMLHGLRSGTDAHVGWVRWLYVGCLGAVAGAVGIRAIVAAPAPTQPAVAR